MSSFQLGLIGVFSFFIVVAILIFTGILPGFGPGSGDYGGEVVLWGTLPENKIRTTLEQFNQNNKNLFVLTYEQKDKQTFETELVEALASGAGPDLVLLSQDLIVKDENKLYEIPFSSFSERNFRDTFIEEGELYVTDTGIIALPFSVDPIVMYWNRDILSSVGIANPPRYWDEFLNFVPEVAIVDDNSNINRAAVALGEFQNVSHAKDIIAALILQTGNNIVERSNEGLRVTLNQSSNLSADPAVSAFNFFMQFANPTKPLYTWNKSLPSSRDMFVAENLAIYFGYASELPSLVAQNPHLNFDVARLPQVDGGNIATFGAMYGIAITEKSIKPDVAFRVGKLITDEDFIGAISGIFGTPPVRRSLLAASGDDAYKTVFYDAALVSRGWLDPNPTESSIIFQTMINNVTSGRMRVSEAVSVAHEQLVRLLPNI